MAAHLRDATNDTPTIDGREALVAFFRKHMEAAERGEVLAAAVVIERPAGFVASEWHRGPAASNIVLLGGLTILQHRLAADLNGDG